MISWTFLFIHGPVQMISGSVQKEMPECGSFKPTKRMSFEPRYPFGKVGIRTTKIESVATAQTPRTTRFDDIPLAFYLARFSLGYNLIL